MRKTWGLLSELMGRPKKGNLDDQISSAFASENPLATANSFNEIFVSSIDDLKQHSRVSPVTYHGRTLANSAFLPSVDDYELWSIINTLPLDKPPGYDNIRMKDLINNYSKLKNVLLHIMNGCLQTGNIPQGLKISVIRPIYKSGKKSDKMNYRPLYQYCRRSVLKWRKSFTEVWCLFVRSSRY